MNTAETQATETPEKPSSDPVPRKRLNDMQMGRIYQGEDAPVETAAALPDDSEGGGEAGSAKLKAESAKLKAESEAGAVAGPTSGEAGPADYGTDPGDQETPADETAGTVAGPTSEAAGDETGERKFRHKTLEAAEKSYAHAQAKLTQLAQENAQLKKDQEARRKADAETRAKEQAAAREQFTTQKYEEAMAALAELDEYDPDYKTAAAKVWADCHSAINNYTPEIPAGSATDAASPAGEPSSAPAGNPSDSAGLSDGPGVPEAISEAVDPDEIRNRISGRMADQGVTDAEFTLEDPVFFGFASKAPAVDETGASIPFEAQVDWAIEQTRTHYQRTKSRLLQQAGQPMGRAGSGASAGSSGGADNAPRRMTLNSAIERAQTRRTLT